MSIHTDAAFHKAKAMGAAAGRSYYDWQKLVALSKRELIEAALHLAAVQASSGYEEALEDGSAALLLLNEIRVLRQNRLI